MNAKNTKKGLFALLACAGMATFATAPANAVPVTYEIGPYRAAGYSASWLHSADNCSGAGPDTGIPLCMSGSQQYGITGTISGDLTNGELTITGGMLNIGGRDYDVRSGSMNPFGSGIVSNIRIRNFGRFFFENIQHGMGRPNFFDGETMILWGQNRGAYDCARGYCNDDRPAWGIDLYGRRVSVPEPGVIALLGMGLLAMAATRRRRAHATTI